MRRKDNGQMIILMGIIIALSVFAISSLSADIINIDTTITIERSTSLLSEFAYVKETFGKAMNYNIVNNLSNIKIDENNTLVFKGNPDGITENFTKTRDQLYTLELQYGNILDVKLNKCWYSNRVDKNNIYKLEVTITLYDGSTYITEDVTYSITCET